MVLDSSTNTTDWTVSKLHWNKVLVLVFSLFLIYWFESISITQIIQPQYFIDFFVP